MATDTLNEFRALVIFVSSGGGGADVLCVLPPRPQSHIAQRHTSWVF